MAVSPDFIASQLQKLFAELRDTKTTADLDRRAARALYDSLAGETTRAIGKTDAKLEFAAEHLDQRIAASEASTARRLHTIEQRMGERFDRLEALLKPQTGA